MKSFVVFFAAMFLYSCSSGMNAGSGSVEPAKNENRISISNDANAPIFKGEKSTMIDKIGWFQILIILIVLSGVFKIGCER